MCKWTPRRLILWKQGYEHCLLIRKKESHGGFSFMFRCKWNSAYFIKIGTYHHCPLGSGREGHHGSSFPNLCQKGNDTRHLLPSNGPLSILLYIIHCGPVSLLGCHSTRAQSSMSNNWFSGYRSLASSKETSRILASIPVLYALTWSGCYVIEPWGLNIRKC